MSKIGKKPIVIPEGVTVEIKDESVDIEADSFGLDKRGVATNDPGFFQLAQALAHGWNGELYFLGNLISFCPATALQDFQNPEINIV